jgi:hypothetical protein
MEVIMTNAAHESQEAQEAQSIPEVNVFMITGDIKSFSRGKTKSEMVLTTKSMDGQFSDDHIILIGPDAEIDKKFNPKAKKATVFGRMDSVEVENGRVTIFRAEKVKPTKAKSEYVNLARLVGKVARPYEFYPAAQGKRAFGNLLIKVGEYFGAATAFRYAAQKIKNVGRGAIMQVQGRIEYRDNGFVRLVVDPEETKVLKAAEKEDPFADYMGEMAPATGDEIPF